MTWRLGLAALVALMGPSTPPQAGLASPAEEAWMLPPSEVAWDLGFFPHQDPEASALPQAAFWFPWGEWGRGADPAELRLGPTLVPQGLPRRAPLVLRWTPEAMSLWGDMRAEAWAQLQRDRWTKAWSAGPPLQTPWGPARPIPLEVADDRPGTAWLAPGQGLLRWEAVDPKGLAIFTRSPHQAWP